MIDIKQWRKENNVTQPQLAINIGVSVNALRAWEQGLSVPNEENALKLEKVMRELEKK